MARRDPSLLRPQPSRLQRPSRVSRQANRRSANLTGAVERAAGPGHSASDAESERAARVPASGAAGLGEHHADGETAGVECAAGGRAGAFVRAEQGGAVEAEDEQQSEKVWGGVDHGARGVQHCGGRGVETWRRGCSETGKRKGFAAIGAAVASHPV